MTPACWLTLVWLLQIGAPVGSTTPVTTAGRRLKVCTISSRSLDPLGPAFGASPTCQPPVQLSQDGSSCAQWCGEPAHAGAPQARPLTAPCARAASVQPGRRAQRAVLHDSRQRWTSLVTNCSAYYPYSLQAQSGAPGPSRR